MNSIVTTTELTTGVPTTQTPNEMLAELAIASGCTKGELLAMSPRSDPFNTGTPKDIELAEWFGGVWQLVNPAGKIHIRKLHYILASMARPPLTPDGKPYENTDECWELIQTASRKARYLGTVAASAFTDNRNPDPIINAPEPHNPEWPSWYVDEFEEFRLPYISSHLTFWIDLPDITTEGYDYDAGDQPYHLEIWPEKSTMNSELLPLCKRYGVNLASSAGFASITSAVNLLKRIEELIQMDRPARIYYISDYDPAGLMMPRQVSRQLEFWLWKYGIEADIKLQPLMLTAEQVSHYKLPRIPIKASDLRRANFEDIHGEGAVELDALEAIHPGEFACIVEEAILKYRDGTLASRMDETRYETQTAAESDWLIAIDEVHRDVNELKHEVQAIADKYHPQLDALNRSMQAELKPIRERLEKDEGSIREQVEEAADDLHLDLPPRPEAEIDEPDESNWLFDASRGLDDQIAFYNQHKNGDL